jgi:hypothetical protein
VVENVRKYNKRVRTMIRGGGRRVEGQVTCSRGGEGVNCSGASDSHLCNIALERGGRECQHTREDEPLGGGGGALLAMNATRLPS